MERQYCKRTGSYYHCAGGSTVLLKADCLQNGAASRYVHAKLSPSVYRCAAPNASLATLVHLQPLLAGLQNPDAALQIFQYPKEIPGAWTPADSRQLRNRSGESPTAETSLDPLSLALIEFLQKFRTFRGTWANGSTTPQGSRFTVLRAGRTLGKQYRFE